MSGAKALSEFLRVDTSAAGARRAAQDAAPDPIDRLCAALAHAGESGLGVGEAMAASGLDRSDFLSALATASKLNLVETVEAGGESRLRLSASAMSLY